jgi:YHS domain-containing protein
MLMVFGSLGILAAALSLGGCGGGKTDGQGKKTEAEKTGDKGGSASRDEHGDHGHGGKVATDPAIEEALAQLSPEDRAAAEEQQICPVSGAKLGSMDKPYKVTVKGREVFLCCDGCEDAIKSDPDKYLAKLDQ